MGTSGMVGVLVTSVTKHPDLPRRGLVYFCCPSVIKASFVSQNWIFNYLVIGIISCHQRGSRLKTNLWLVFHPLFCYCGQQSTIQMPPFKCLSWSPTSQFPYQCVSVFTINCNCTFPNPTMGRQYCIAVICTGLNAEDLRFETKGWIVRLDWLDQIPSLPLNSCASLKKLLGFSVNSPVNGEMYGSRSRAEAAELATPKVPTAIAEWQRTPSAQPRDLLFVSTPNTRSLRYLPLLIPKSMAGWMNEWIL